METTRYALAIAALAASLLFISPKSFADSYSQTNLVSDIAGLAATTDPNLKNPWGLTFSSVGPFWVSDQKTGVATIYNGNGIVPLVVGIPGGGAPGATGPTGLVFNSTSQFQLANNQPTIFLFATLNGTIAGWNGGNVASTAATVTGAVFTGLAIGNNGVSNFLYAADFRNGRIDVFNSNFAPTTLPGSFTDPTLPAGYAPYNIQNLGGKLYVEYAPPGPTGAVPGAGKGVIAVFDMNGNFQTQLVAAGGPLNDPWGVTLSPSSFGTFGNDLLVGNFGNGEINAFDPTTGTFLGTLDNPQGQPIVDSGLWGLVFGNGGAGGNTNTLYFNAGINGEADGLFGSIQPAQPVATPEPGTLLLLSTGLLGLMGMGLYKKRLA